MENLKDIQELINAKADKKLEDAVRALCKSVSDGENYNLIKGITINIGTTGKPKNIGLYSIFSSDGFAAKIIENNTQRYRDIESELFLKKVESLRDNVDHLLDSVNQ
jgi:hypothetical protein